MPPHPTPWPTKVPTLSFLPDHSYASTADVETGCESRGSQLSEADGTEVQKSVFSSRLSIK